MSLISQAIATRPIRSHERQRSLARQWRTVAHAHGPDHDQVGVDVTTTRLARGGATLREARELALDPRSRELEWSPALCSIAGLPPDATPSFELLLERVVPEERARFQAGYERALMQPPGGQLDVRLRHRDGTLIRHIFPTRRVGCVG